MTVEAESELPAAVNAALQKALPFATAADALARRIVGKVRALALIGSLAALGVTFACADTFDWKLPAALVTFALLIVPAAILWKLHGTLLNAVGLPQRLGETAGRLLGKTSELKRFYDGRPDAGGTDAPRPGFRQIWRTGKGVFEAKWLDEKVQAIAADVAGAAVVANPVFAILLTGASAVTIALSGLACVIGLAYLF